MQIIEAARHLLDTDPEIRFLLVGSGRDEQLFKAASESLPNICFAGEVENVGMILKSFCLLATVGAGLFRALAPFGIYVADGYDSAMFFHTEHLAKKS